MIGPSGYGLAPFIKRAIDTVIAQKIPLSFLSKIKKEQKEEVIDYFQELKELVVSMKSQIDALVRKDDLHAFLERASNYELAFEKIVNALTRAPALMKKSTTELTKILKKDDSRLTPFLEKSLERPFTALEVAQAKVKQKER